MPEDIREIERPFHVVVVLDGRESFHSGHFDKETAQSRCNQANEKAIALNIKSRYIVKENLRIIEEVK